MVCSELTQRLDLRKLYSGRLRVCLSIQVQMPQVDECKLYAILVLNFARVLPNCTEHSAQDNSFWIFSLMFFEKLITCVVLSGSGKIMVSIQEFYLYINHLSPSTSI